MRLERYLTEVTYEQYCQGIDDSFISNEGIVSDIKDKAVSMVSSSFNVIKDELLEISQDLGVGLMDIMDALKSKNVYNILISVGFNVKILFRSMVDALGLINKGLLEVFKEIHKTEVYKKLKSGTMRVDEVLDQYPLLKKLTGPIMAGLLLYMWINSSFTGKFSDDFDMSDVLKALSGAYTISDLISTPEGIMKIVLVLSGPIISFTWLSGTIKNLIMAVIFTAAKNSNHPVNKKIKEKVSKHMKRL